MQIRSDFYATAVITFANGVVQELAKGDFYLENGVVDSAETSSFPYGVVIPKSTTLSLVNDRDRWRNYSFDGAKIQLYTNYDLDSGRTERINLGEYTVLEPETYGEVITVTAMDDCYKLDKPYTTSLTFPTSALNVYLDIETQTGINIATAQFDNQDLQIKKKPEDVTFRQVMGAICGIAGGNGRFDSDNRFRIIKYDADMFRSVIGGSFDEGSSIPGLLQGYMNTTDGMTAVVTAEQNNKVFSFDGPSWFYLFGRNASKIYVDCRSLFQFGGTAPFGYVKNGPGIQPYASGYGGASGVLCGLYYRSLTIGDRLVFKIRWEGYNRGTTAAGAPSGSALKYEMFLFDDGYIFFNIIQAPTTENIHSNALRFVLPDSTRYISFPKASIASAGSQFYAYHEESGNNTFVLCYDANDLSAAAYSTGDALEGGTFRYWDGWSSHDEGDFSAQSGILTLSDFAPGLTMTTDDVVITGVQIETDDGTYLAKGSEEGYILAISNVLADEIEQTLIDRVGTALIGMRFRPFTGDHTADPEPEAMDLIYFLDQNGNLHTSVITDVNFCFSGYTTVKCSADSPLRNSAAFFSGQTSTVRAARRASSAGIDKYSKAVQMMMSLITNGLGLFFSEEPLDNGGSIYYLHDHQNRGASKNVWRMSGNVFSVSSDGGKTWNAGIDSDGNAVVNVLSAIGIVFDWAHGGQIRLGGADNSNGTLAVLNSSNENLISLDQKGIQISTNASDKIRIYEQGIQYVRYLDEGPIAMALSGYLYYDQQLSNTDDTRYNVLTYAVQIPDNIPLSRSSESAIVFGYFKEPVKSKVTLLAFATTAYSVQSMDVILASVGITGTTLESKATAPAFSAKFVVAGGALIKGNGRFNGSVSATGNIYAKKAIYTEGSISAAGRMTAHGGGHFHDSVYIGDDLTVIGSKSRACKTKHYDTVLMGAYETSTPYFGDIGSGITDEDGVCYVEIDDIFTEVANTTAEYHVFLQKEGPGDLWIDQKQPGFFVVRGTPHLKFSWEIKAMQLGYEMTRNERFEKGEENETA